MTFTAAAKDRARTTLIKAVKSGKVQRPTCCSACGSGYRVQGHHPDYSKPLQVVWLCSDCHLLLHHPTAFRQLAQEARRMVNLHVYPKAIAIAKRALHSPAGGDPVPEKQQGSIL